MKRGGRRGNRKCNNSGKIKVKRRCDDGRKMNGTRGRKVLEGEEERKWNREK